MSETKVDTPKGTVKCPTCEGFGHVLQTRGLEPSFRAFGDTTDCPDCGGEGLEYLDDYTPTGGREG